MHKNIIKRKADVSTWKDRVKERDIDFLTDLNAEHAFQSNYVLYLAFVIGCIRTNSSAVFCNKVYEHSGGNHVWSA